MINDTRNNEAAALTISGIWSPPPSETQIGNQSIVKPTAHADAASAKGERS